MSEINVTVVGSTTECTLVSSCETISVSIGEVSPGNATIVAGTISINSTTTLPAGSNATVVNKGTGYAASLDFGIPAGPASNLTIGTVSTGATAAATITGASPNQVLNLTLPPGPASNLTIGTVSTGATALATIAGNPPNQVLNLTLPIGPQGIQGIQGNAGPTTNLTIGTVTKGDNAAAVISGTPPNLTLNLTLPKGDVGPYSNIVVGGTTTGNAGTQAKVEATTLNGTVSLNFTIPRGDPGQSNLGDETPQPLGIASAGSAAAAARADHVHNLPVIAWGNLSGVPSNFASNIASVSGLQAALDGKQAAGNYATLVNGLVPSAQLPSYVDDVVEVASLATLPGTGESGKLYVTIDTRKVYRWSGSGYVEISASPGTTDAVPEGSTNLYFTANRAVTSLNNLTGSLSLVAGSNVTVSSANSTITISASGGGLDSNAAVDGGNYVGETLYGITYTTQPQSQTVSSSTTVNLTTVVPNLSPTTYAAAGVFALNSMLYAPSATWSSGSNQATAAMLVSSDNGATFSVAETYGYMSVIDDNPVAHLGLTKPVFAATNGTRTVYTTGFWAWNNSYINTMARYTDSANITTSPASTPLTGAVASASGVAYGAGRFVAAVVNGFNVELYSATDAVNWTLRYTLGISAFGGLAFGAGTFFFREYSGLVLSSPDGVNWAGANETGTSIAASGSRAVIVNNTTTARYTTNGTTWLSATLPVACSEVSYAAGLFWAFAATSGTDVCTSPDGITWTLRTLPVTATWIRAAAAGGAALIRSSGANFAQGATVSVPASANLTVSATAASGTPVSYQWQTSVDAGSSWANVSNATSSLLTLSGLTQSNNGTRYRTLATANGAVPAYSQSALLTVTG